MDPTVPALVGAALYLLDLAIKIAAIGVIPGNRKPSSAMAWLILILILPFAGLAIFLFLGRTHVGARRLARQREAEAAIRDATRRVVTTGTPRPAPGWPRRSCPRPSRCIPTASAPRCSPAAPAT